MQNMTEDEAIKAAQDAFGDLKGALRQIQKINTKEGRLKAANAAMRLRGKVIVIHAEGTDDLFEHYPESAGVIVTRGGGGR